MAKKTRTFHISGHVCYHQVMANPLCEKTMPPPYEAPKGYHWVVESGPRWVLKKD